MLFIATEIYKASTLHKKLNSWSNPSSTGESSNEKKVFKKLGYFWQRDFCQKSFKTFTTGQFLVLHTHFGATDNSLRLFIATFYRKNFQLKFETHLRMTSDSQEGSATIASRLGDSFYSTGSKKSRQSQNQTFPQKMRQLLLGFPISIENRRVFLLFAS